MMSPVTALLVSLSVLTSSGESYASSFATKAEQEAYLKKYAYMGSSSPDPRLASITDPTEKFKMAVMKFQMMAGINETGVVCNETVKMMEMPRCGQPDEVGMSMVTKRRRRRRYAAQGSRWPRTGLTYRINNYTSDLRQDVIDSEIQTAFQRWRDVSPMTFTNVRDKRTKVDIDIYFDNQDGVGKTLAYAYFPQYGGDAHFDDDDQWTSNTSTGTNLLWVAIHEFGHSLGLSHSEVNDAVMYPFYRGYRPNVQLHTDDIAGIQYVYGSMMSQTQTTRRSTTRARFSLSTPGFLPTSTRRSLSTYTTRMPPSGHDICRDPTVDAIFAVNEDVYVFKGAEYYMGRRRRFLSRALPIDRYNWPGLPRDIDTAVYLDGSIVFFKGHQCWRYNSSRHPIGLSPQNISTVFPRLPSNIDAAFVWSGNGKLYVIKGDKYYRLSKSWFSKKYRVDSYYPQPLRIWKGLPSKIDAAFSYTNGRTYFFSGSNYYRFNDVSSKVDSGYPKLTATHWLGCSDRSQSDVKAPAEDMMEQEWMAGGDQFMAGGGDQSTPSGRGGESTSGCVGLPTYSVFLSTIAVLASCLLVHP